MVGEIVIRRAGFGDLGALNALTQASKAYEGAYRAILDGYEITRAQVTEDCVYLAGDASGLLGYYSLKLQPEPELDLMFVADRAQGGGLGARLFAHMTDVARKEGCASVKIVSHPPSAGFYRRMGATEVGVSAPKGRITWARPVLHVVLGGQP